MPKRISRLWQRIVKRRQAERQFVQKNLQDPEVARKAREAVARKAREIHQNPKRQKEYEQRMREEVNKPGFVTMLINTIFRRR